MASTNSHIRINADIETGRLTNVLHAVQAHPDYEYSVTFPHCADAHTPREGWERNPQADQTPHAVHPQMLGWRRLKDDVPAVSSFEDDAEYGAGWNEPPVNLSRTV